MDYSLCLSAAIVDRKCVVVKIWCDNTSNIWPVCTLNSTDNRQIIIKEYIRMQNSVSKKMLNHVEFSKADTTLFIITMFRTIIKLRTCVYIS